MVAAPDVGYRAEGAEAVAALRDLDEGARPLDGAERLGQGGLPRRGQAEHVADHAHDAVLVLGAHEGGDLGELVGERVAVAGGHAAAHHDRAGADALRALLGELERGLDRLLGGRGEKRAGVDDGDVGVGRLGGLLEAVREQEGPHAVGVNLVLGAAERDDEKAHVTPSASGS